MPPKPKVPKITLAMLKHIDPLNLRTFMIRAMELPAATAFKMADKEREAWFLAHIAEFCALDLRANPRVWENISQSKRDFICALQEYMQGVRPEPPPLDVPYFEEIVVVTTPDTETPDALWERDAEDLEEEVEAEAAVDAAAEAAITAVEPGDTEMPAPAHTPFRTVAPGAPAPAPTPTRLPSPTATTPQTHAPAPTPPGPPRPAPQAARPQAAPSAAPQAARPQAAVGAPRPAPATSAPAVAAAAQAPVLTRQEVDPAAPLPGAGPATTTKEILASFKAMLAGFAEVTGKLDMLARDVQILRSNTRALDTTVAALGEAVALQGDAVVKQVQQTEEGFSLIYGQNQESHNAMLLLANTFLTDENGNPQQYGSMAELPVHLVMSAAEEDASDGK